MKRETLILKMALILIAAPVLIVCVFLFPGANFLRETNEGPGYMQYVVIYLYVSVIPFFYALYQAYKLLLCIDKDEALSELSLKALKTIKYCALIICAMFVAGLPFLYYMAKADDAPGILMFGSVFALASFAVTVFAAILHKLLKNALDGKLKKV